MLEYITFLIVVIQLNSKKHKIKFQFWTVSSFGKMTLLWRCLLHSGPHIIHTKQSQLVGKGWSVKIDFYQKLFT